MGETRGYNPEEAVASAQEKAAAARGTAESREKTTRERMEERNEQNRIAEAADRKEAYSRYDIPESSSERLKNAVAEFHGIDSRLERTIMGLSSSTDKRRDISDIRHDMRGLESVLKSAEEAGASKETQEAMTRNMEGNKRAVFDVMADLISK